MGPLRPEASRMLLLFLLLLLLLGSGPVPVATSRRSHVFPRGIKELADTVTCVGPRPPIVYMQYGCFCGLGGHGQPRDSIDWCCYHHDCCYALAEEAGCSPKMGSYPWKCVDNQVQCGPAENKCQELMCECDRNIAYCLAEAEYNLKYLFYPHFLCEQESPTCDQPT
ncbi:Group 10 secretory phospholipase A2 [Heterocephalus glaber]|uniref:Phospholipase A2 n=1 Tax=Heterocephalus glaber TaxID=10181 RepID=G5B4E8_HETGA|nr:group 10 secretory phospholipase A2 isoform X1 [Heterocephalus glaber]EHB04159.1 Group 10 secretory phospholipase A2 [Heterocephalus glaber]